MKQYICKYFTIYSVQYQFTRSYFKKGTKSIEEEKKWKIQTHNKLERNIHDEMKQKEK